VFLPDPNDWISAHFDGRLTILCNELPCMSGRDASEHHLSHLKPRPQWKSCLPASTRPNKDPFNLFRRGFSTPNDSLSSASSCPFKSTIYTFAETSSKTTGMDTIESNLGARAVASESFPIELRNPKRPHPQDNSDTSEDEKRPDKRRAAATFRRSNSESSNGPNSPIDWKESLCQALHVPHDIEEAELEKALRTISVLFAPKCETATSNGQPKLEPSYAILYRVFCQRNFEHQKKIYADEPMYRSSDTSEFKHLAGRKEITDITRFVERTPGICFVPIREYRCCYLTNRTETAERPPIEDETIYLVDEALCLALVDFQEEAMTPGDPIIWPEIKPHQELRNLQYWLYYRQDSLKSFLMKRAGKSQPVLACFQSYMQESKRDEYREVAEMQKEGKVTRRHIRYLFVCAKPKEKNAPD